MIHLTTLRGESFVLNADKILCIEQQADTIVRCVTGNSFRVRETAEAVINMVIQFNRNIIGYGCLGRYLAPEPGEQRQLESDQGCE